MFYKIIEIIEGVVTFKYLDNDQKESGDFMYLPKDEIPHKMLLCYAYTYHKTQGRTIRGSIRLAETSSRNFSLRHLIVGSGRAPEGIDLQVM